MCACIHPLTVSVCVCLARGDVSDELPVCVSGWLNREQWPVRSSCWTPAFGCGWSCPSSSSLSSSGSSVTMLPSCCTATKRWTWSRCPTGGPTLSVCQHFVVMLLSSPLCWLSFLSEPLFLIGRLVDRTVLSLIPCWCLCSARCSCAAASSERMESTFPDR